MGVLHANLEKEQFKEFLKVSYKIKCRTGNSLKRISKLTI